MDSHSLVHAEHVRGAGIMSPNSKLSGSTKRSTPRTKPRAPLIEQNALALSAPELLSKTHVDGGGLHGRRVLQLLLGLDENPQGECGVGSFG